MQKAWHILVYHEISWEENPFLRGLGGTCPPNLFAQHVAMLSQQGGLVSIEEGLSRTTVGALDQPLFSFWFDDGYAGVRKYALPLLEKRKVTAAISVCSRFVNRTELFWRCKLSYLHYIDGLRFLRSRLRKLGYVPDTSVKNFCLDNFSEQIVKQIDDVFNLLTSEAERRDAQRLFETPKGLLELRDRGWVVANHTSAHYPIGEEHAVGLLKQQFEECEDFFRSQFGASSGFWVLPFDRRRAGTLGENLGELAGNRRIVFVGNDVNTQQSLKTGNLYRHDPILYGAEPAGRVINA